MPPAIDKTGWRVGRVVVLARGPRLADGNGTWLCRCDCGTAMTVRASNLTRTKSCGCIQRNKEWPYGQTAGPLYVLWKSMIRRCGNPKAAGYAHYGGRGIIVCDRWRDSFLDFLRDMGRPPDGGTIDRIDNDGNYEPGNCRWATHAEQNLNKRDTVMVAHNGETLPLFTLAERLGIDPYRLWSQHRRKGHSLDVAIERARHLTAVGPARYQRKKRRSA